MRLWSLHPKYLDSKGLVALWREGLLAQKVLQNATKGYTNHPQLIRFRETKNALGAIATYLRHVAAEADRRGYSFDKSKIVPNRILSTLPVTDQQVAHERRHLLAKLEVRNVAFQQKLLQTKTINIHPLFRKVRGKIEAWERL